MKCDETQPRCKTCRFSGISCGGYEKRIFFDFEGTPEDGLGRFRRPLLTEDERENMSRMITGSVQPSRAMWHIAKIDEECENTPDLQEVQVSCGPFGVFRLATGVQNATPASTLDSAEIGQEVPRVDNDQFLEDYDDVHQGLFLSSDTDLIPTSNQVAPTLDAICDERG